MSPRTKSVRVSKIAEITRIESQGTWEHEAGDILWVKQPSARTFPMVGVHLTGPNIGFGVNSSMIIYKADQYSHYDLHELDIDLTLFLRDSDCATTLDTHAYQLNVQDQNFKFIWEGKAANCSLDSSSNPTPDNLNYSVSYNPVNGFHSKVHLKSFKRSMAIFYVSRDFIFDRYEISRLDFDAKISILGKVDLEVSANNDNAQQFIVVVVFDGQLSIPFHLRYQPPSLQLFKNVRFAGPIIVEQIEREKCPGSLMPAYFMQFLGNECIYFKPTPDQYFRLPTGDVSYVERVSIFTNVIVLIGVLMLLFGKCRQKKLKQD